MHLRSIVAPLLPLLSIAPLAACSAESSEVAATHDEAVSGNAAKTYAAELRACQTTWHEAQGTTSRSRAALGPYSACLHRATTKVVPAIDRKLGQSAEGRVYRGQTAGAMAALRAKWDDVCAVLPGAFDANVDSRMPPGALRQEDIDSLKKMILAQCVVDRDVFIAREIASIVDFGSEIPVDEVLPQTSTRYGTDCRRTYEEAPGDSTAEMNEASTTFRACMIDVAKSVGERVRRHSGDAAGAAWPGKLDAADAAGGELCVLLVHAGSNVGGTLSSIEASGCAGSNAGALAQTSRWGADYSPDPGIL
jgi:hypothetical protein